MTSVQLFAVIIQDAFICIIIYIFVLWSFVLNYILIFIINASLILLSLILYRTIKV